MKVLILLFSSIYISCSAQNILSFSEVIHVDSGTTKEQLFERARLWFSTYAKDAKEAVQVYDKETGEIHAKASFAFSSMFYVGSGATRGRIWYNLNIYCKDGRYKYEVTNITHEGSAAYSQYGSSEGISFGVLTTDSLCPPERYPYEMAKKWRNNLWAEIKETARLNIPPIIASLKIAMAIPTASNRDDW